MIRVILTLALFLLPSVALGEIFNECRPMSFSVGVSADFDFAEDMEQRLSTAVETRLRSARIFDADHIPSINVSIATLETAAEGLASSVQVQFTRWLWLFLDYYPDKDNSDLLEMLSPLARITAPYPDVYFEQLDLPILQQLNVPILNAVVWDRTLVTLEPVSGQGSHAIENALEIVDEFILEYLRRNEAFCT